MGDTLLLFPWLPMLLTQLPMGLPTLPLLLPTLLPTMLSTPPLWLPTLLPTTLSTPPLWLPTPSTLPLLSTPPLLSMPPVVHAVAHAAPVAGYAAGDLAEVSPYTYNYGVADDYSKAAFSQTESNDGTGVVEGSYQVNLPDGRVQTVNYHANDV